MIMKTRYLIFSLVLVLGAAWTLPAEAGYTFTVTEDYTNEDGTPGLDPLFNHSFSEGASATPEEAIDRWWVNISQGVWKYSMYLAPGVTDTVTFNLEPGWKIVEATVERLSLQHGVFIGDTGSRVFDTTITPEDSLDYWTVASEEIGVIQSIELTSSQGHIGDITLTISAVPEPSVLLLLVGGMPFLMLFRRRKTQ